VLYINYYFSKVKDCDEDERCGWGVGGYEMIVENLFIERLSETLCGITVSKCCDAFLLRFCFC